MPQVSITRLYNASLQPWSPNDVCFQLPSVLGILASTCYHQFTHILGRTAYCQPNMVRPAPQLHSFQSCRFPEAATSTAGTAPAPSTAGTEPIASFCRGFCFQASPAWAAAFPSADSSAAAKDVEHQVWHPAFQKTHPCYQTRQDFKFVIPHPSHCEQQS